MRIVHVAIRFPPAEGGGEQHVYNLAKQQVKIGHKVYVITTNLIREIPRKVDKHLLKEETIDYIKVIRKKTYPTFLPVWGYGSIFFGLKKLVSEINPDIVHGHGYGYFYIDALARAKKKYKPRWKLILTSHGFAGGRGIFKHPKIVYDKLIGEKTVKLLDGTIALSKNDKRIFEKLGAKKVYVVPNGFDISRFASLPDKTAFKNRYNLSGKIILNISRLAVSKGQKYLIKAFSQIIPDFPDLKLVIIGEDWGEMKNLKLLVKNLRLEDKVLLPGLVSAQDVLEAFSASEIFVLPSLAEGLPTVILEAMASGLPIVATDVGGVAETLNGVGLVIRAANANQLAENMRKLLEDDELRKRCSKLGRERVKRYDWPRVARDVVRVYEDILGVK